MFFDTFPISNSTGPEISHDNDASRTSATVGASLGQPVRLPVLNISEAVPC